MYIVVRKSIIDNPFDIPNVHLLVPMSTMCPVVLFRSLISLPNQEKKVENVIILCKSNCTLSKGKKGQRSYATPSYHHTLPCVDQVSFSLRSMYRTYIHVKIAPFAANTKGTDHPSV